MTGRNLATKALGYAVNQEQELRRVFLDGRQKRPGLRSGELERIPQFSAPVTWIRHPVACYGRPSGAC